MDQQEDEAITVDGVYNELIHLRKMNRVLGDRIKHLEVQNFHMTKSQGFGVNQYKAEEPARPIFSGGNVQSPPKIDTGFATNTAFQTPADQGTEEAKSSSDYDDEDQS